MQATLNECFKTAPHVSFIKKIYYDHMKKYKPLVPYTIDVCYIWSLVNILGQI